MSARAASTVTLVTTELRVTRPPYLSCTRVLTFKNTESLPRLQNTGNRVTVTLSKHSAHFQYTPNTADTPDRLGGPCLAFEHSCRSRGRASVNASTRSASRRTACTSPPSRERCERPRPPGWAQRGHINRGRMDTEIEKQHRKKVAGWSSSELHLPERLHRVILRFTHSSYSGVRSNSWHMAEGSCTHLH